MEPRPGTTLISSYQLFYDSTVALPTYSISSDGVEQWSLDGHLHRHNNPAYKTRDGYEEWRVQGALHRIDGPAVKFPDNVGNEFHIDGVHLSEQEYNLKIAQLNAGELSKLYEL